MYNKRRFPIVLGPQRGVSLIIALVMLLIMTVIGISSMNLSISKLKTTSGIRQQSIVSNSAEETLTMGELIADNLLNNSEVFFTVGAAVDWVDPINGADSSSNFIIEHLGKRFKDGAAIGSGTGSVVAGDVYHIFRITARSTAADKTTRKFQSLYISENSPN
jgi:type IV pilus assembly protein PilX